MPFNSSRYSFSQGNLSDGFQGRPDLGIYRQGIKESQNFFSGLDGAARFRKAFSQGLMAAPKPDSSDITTGGVKTIPMFVKPGFIGSAPIEGGWVFFDFCLGKVTGKYTQVYYRVGDKAYGSLRFSGDPTYVPPNIASNTSSGVITLVSDLKDELHRVGSFINLKDGSIRTPVIISEADPADKDIIKVVQADGQPFTSMPDRTGDGLDMMGGEFDTPIEQNFDWVIAGNDLYIVDGFNRYKITMLTTESTPIVNEAYAITNSPFPTDDNPAVIGLYQNRLIYSGFVTEPDLLALSRSPDPSTGGTRYDDFTTGVLATDAIKVYINPDKLSPVSAIKWAEGSSRALLLGTNEGIVEITSQGVALAPDDIAASVFSFKDPSGVKPKVFDNYVNWVSLDGGKIYESSFSFDFDADISYNLTQLVNVKSPIIEMINFTGKEEGLIALQEDGDILLGLRSSDRGLSFFPISVFMGETVAPGDIISNIFSYSDEEGQIIGMNIVKDEGGGEGEDEYKTLEFSVERFFRYDFVFSLPELFPFISEYNTLVTTFFNGIKFNQLDDSFSHSISADAYGSIMTLLESDNGSYDIKITSDTGTNLSDKKLLLPEIGIAIEYAQEITPEGDFYANYLFTEEELDENIFPLKLGASRLSKVFVSFSDFNISTNSLLDPLALVISDGKIDKEADISEAENGYGYYSISLSDDTFFAHVGLKYTGMFTMVPLSTSGSGQLGVNRKKSIAEIMFRLINTGDGQVWINRIAAEDFDFKDPGIYNWKPYINDTYAIRPQSSWEGKTEITFFQKEPQPLNISLVDIYEEVSRE